MSQYALGVSVTALKPLTFQANGAALVNLAFI